MKKIWTLLMGIICSVGIAICVAQAWFVNGFDVDPLATGSSSEAYYHSGTGTSSDPYIITTPRHLYNLAWLQYLGAYNKDKKTGTTFPATYFKVGVNGAITIDMTGWPLPPIGTTKYPFIGNFNGNGSTIKNLTTTNSFNDFGDKHPSGVDSIEFQADNCGAIGFFGSIGPYNGNVISESDFTTDFSYDSTSNKVYNFYLYNTNVHTYRSTTLIGSVAGYVNGKIEDVGVVAPHLNIAVSATSKLQGKTQNLSDFAVVGYAEEAYTTQKTKSSTIIYNPTYDYSHFNFKGMGSQSDWGGSIDMTSLYNRINSQINSTTLSNYVNGEIKYNYQHAVVQTTTSPSSTHYYKAFSDGSGAYLTQNTPGYNGYDYLTALYKNLIIINKTGTINGGQTIANSLGGYLDIYSSRVNNNSLSYNVSLELEATSNPRVWIFSGNHLYTYNEDDGIPYYLNVDSSLSLSVSDTYDNTWSWDSNNSSYYVTIDGNNYYLKYFNDEWTIKNTYAIGDGFGYMTYNGTIGYSTDIEDAAAFVFSNDGTNPSGTIQADNGYYLRNNNGALQIRGTNSNNNWSNDDGCLYNVLNDTKYYLQYDSNDGWKIVQPQDYYIQYNGNYLYIDNTGQLQTAGTNNVNNATIFTLSDDLEIDGGEGTISTEINGVTYYLRYNGTTFSSVTSEDSYTTWINEQGLAIELNDDLYYIQYDNGWKVQTCAQKVVGYAISSNSQYLNVSGTTITAGTTLYTAWNVDNNDYLYTEIGGVRYYVYRSNTTPRLTTDIAQGSLFKRYNTNYLKTENGDRYLYYRAGNNYNRWYTNTTATQVSFATAYTLDYENTPIGQVIPSNVNSLSLDKISKSIINNSAQAYEYTRTEGTTEASVFNYIPLNTENDYSIANNNTGYLMSGGYSGSSGSLTNVDIRLAGGSTPYTISWGLSNSVNTNGTIKANSVYTIDSSGHHAINDSTNSYQKYTSSRSDMEKTLKATVTAGTAVGGIHFITSLISINRLVNAPKVVINGTEHTNYKMPENSFDFALKKKGYINFFAGLYYPGNQSFFSLHKIERASDQTITAIKNISKIYGTDNKRDPYVYLYTDGTYSGGYNSLPSGYTEIFDCTWIESPTISSWDVSSYGSGYKNNGAYMKKLYYFEIPVNEGEYCLGSVNGLDGGYLMYLDIGANASVVDRTTITQQSNVVSQNMEYATGIQLLAANTSFTSDANTAVAIIEAQTTGTISISRNGDTISFGGTSLDSTYWDDVLTVTDGTLNVPTDTSITKVLKYIDYNNGTGTLYYATVVDVDETSTYVVREIDGETNPIIVTSESSETEVEEALYGLLKIGTGDDSGYGVVDTAAGAISGNSFATSTKTVEYYYYIPTSVITNDGVDYSFDMNVTQVTGTETISGFVISGGEYEFNDGYTSSHCYKLVGDDITYVFTQIPTGLTNTKFVVTTKDSTYTVTINSITIAVGNYTYTFSNNTIAVSS